jgi:SAM-dependent methyltransferase
MRGVLGLEGDWLAASSPFFELSAKQTSALLKVARVGRRDVFYDLGCGKGLVVRKAISEAHARRATGVEIDFDMYERAKVNAIVNLSKSKLKLIDFWPVSMENPDLDYSDATVVYHSLEEEEHDLEFYRENFRVKRIRLVKKDLPLVGYLPAATSRESNSCWFFVMKFPLRRAKNESEWCSGVLGKPDVGLKDVFGYYRRQLENRGLNSRTSINNLRALAKTRFK